MKKYIPAVTAAIVIIAYAVITTIPTFFVKYNYSRNGISIYSDEPIDREIDKVIDTVNARIKHLDFSAHVNNAKVYIINNRRNFSFITNVSFRAFGTTKTLLNNIIIARSDIKNNVITRNGKENNKSKLDEIITHELVHVYTNKYLGKLRSLSTTRWKAEGYCEYIAQHSSFDIEKGFQLFLSKEDNKSKAYQYFKYRVMVTYLMDKKMMTFEKIRKTKFNVKELENQIIDEIKNDTYTPNFVSAKS